MTLLQLSRMCRTDAYMHSLEGLKGLHFLPKGFHYKIRLNLSRNLSLELSSTQTCRNTSWLGWKLPAIKSLFRKRLIRKILLEAPCSEQISSKDSFALRDAWTFLFWFLRTLRANLSRKLSPYPAIRPSYYWLPFRKELPFLYWWLCNKYKNVLAAGSGTQWK